MYVIVQYVCLVLITDTFFPQIAAAVVVPCLSTQVSEHGKNSSSICLSTVQSSCQKLPHLVIYKHFAHIIV